MMIVKLIGTLLLIAVALIIMFFTALGVVTWITINDSFDIVPPEDLKDQQEGEDEIINN